VDIAKPATDCRQVSDPRLIRIGECDQPRSDLPNARPR
jgi:hypothetical protein